jgi:hypothetical protein
VDVKEDRRGKREMLGEVLKEDPHDQPETYINAISDRGRLQRPLNRAVACSHMC